MATKLQEKNTFISEYIDAIWVNKDLSRFEEFFNQNARFRSPLAETKDLGAIKQYLADYHKAFPDLKFETVEIFGQDDNYCWVCTVSGTGKGNFLGMNIDGKKIHYQACTYFKFENNKIQESRVFYDLYDIFQQLGLVQQVFKPLRK